MFLLSLKKIDPFSYVISKLEKSMKIRKSIDHEKFEPNAHIIFMYFKKKSFIFLEESVAKVFINKIMKLLITLIKEVDTSNMLARFLC